MGRDQEKLAYRTPEVQDLGGLVELTAHNHDGQFTDATFPAGTPRGSLTFSG